MSLRFFTADERPDLREQLDELVTAWPRFMLEDPVATKCFGLLYEHFGAFQHFLVATDTDELVAEVNSLPVAVDLDALPDRGWDDVLERGTAREEAPTAVSAIQVLIRADRHAQGLSTMCLERMRGAAGEHGFDSLVAPVRPTLKARYPLTPIDRYVRWTNGDGLPFDPWLRVHARLGATIVRPCRESMTIPGRSRTGRSGRECASPRAVRMSSRARSSPSSSIATPTAGCMSSRTSGCCTPSEPLRTA